ncbi:peroxisome assembly protein 12-like [Montipora capricornis]|uniref:peroxisome assembly protein 12-like n=1 Tax=Montipora capricornis TaxID=246305 RepID=UPI0035F1923C
MAEFAAHLNQGTANANPTIFEIIAEESMASILRPAVGYALKVLATSNPDKWGWVWRIGDEIYLCLDYFVQNHYLKNSGGSISENFYGLKRVNTGITGKKEEGISSIQRYLSVIMLVGVPYAKLKLDELFERTREDYITGNQTSYPRRKRSYFLQLKRTFVYVYPFLHFTWETVFLCYYLMYVFQFSEVHSPLLHVIGVSLKRLTRQDILTQNVQNSHINLLKGKNLTEKLSAIPGSLGRLVVVVLANGLPVIVFFLKFIEWWYSSDNKEAVQSVIQLPVPPPPPGPKPAQHGVQLPPHPVQCPLCWKVRTNPTALSSSGYVFCYPCIYKYLNQHGCCPITHLPSATKQLIRLYVDVTN